MSPGMARRRVFASLIAIAAAVAALSASAADAATVTVGSPMKQTFPTSYTTNGSVLTVANVILAEPGAHVTSPASGTITKWRVKTTGPGQFAIRVLRPTSNGHFLGAGTSSRNVTSAGVHTFTASLAIQAGDLVGLNIPDNSLPGMSGEIAGNFMAGKSTWVSLPPVADGSQSGFADPFYQQELLFNADVEYPDPTTTAPPTTTPTTPTTPSANKRCKKKHKRSAAAAKKKCKKKKH